jgi:hypothetical protein
MLASCNHKDSKSDVSNVLSEVCQSEAICEKHLNIWFDEFTKRNSINESEFLKHISLTEAKVESWDKGKSLRVIYTVSIDWVSILVHDTFIIWIEPSNETYPYLNLPKGEYLLQSEVSTVLDYRAFGSSLTPIIFSEQLKFKNPEEALQALQNDANTENMFIDKLSFKTPGFSSNKEGYPWLHGMDATNEVINECVRGFINLVTGETNYRTIRCSVHGS